MTILGHIQACPARFLAQKTFVIWVQTKCTHLRFWANKSNNVLRLTLEYIEIDFFCALSTHLSYRKNSRTHSTPVSTTKLLFVLTSDFGVRLSTHFRCSTSSFSIPIVLTSMQGSHSSIFDALCTHFRFTNKQIVLTTRGESKCTNFRMFGNLPA